MGAQRTVHLKAQEGHITHTHTHLEVKDEVAQHCQTAHIEQLKYI